MSDKADRQLVNRLARLAKVLWKESECFHTPKMKAQFRAWSRTCDKSSIRLKGLIELEDAIVKDEHPYL